MTTLAILKAEIADDIRDASETSAIASAINRAIERYQTHRFYFNTVRTLTFATVDGTSIYTSSEDTDIPKFIEFDGVFLNDGSNNYELVPLSATEMQWLLDSSASESRPRRYSYYEESFRLYPIPDAVYTVTPMGLVEKAAPATDGEANNVWMVEAYELIRCRAKLYLAIHTLFDSEMAQLMVSAEEDALSALKKKSAKKGMGAGIIQSTQF